MKKIFDEIPHIEGGVLVLKRMTRADAKALEALISDEEVYKYLPTFLFEKKYDDVNCVIDRMYSECFANRESVFMGIYQNGSFCGIAELYGCSDSIHKISIGYRLLREYWGRGIATAAVGLMVKYIYTETDTEIITASTMVENHASAKVLRKNGFDMVVASVDEDWGYPEPTKADKWIR